MLYQLNEKSPGRTLSAAVFTAVSQTEPGCGFFACMSFKADKDRSSFKTDTCEQQCYDTIIMFAREGEIIVESE